MTLGDVARRSGVSISAVSRVLANHPSARVSTATRERILLAAEQLRYRPNFAGRALKSSRTQVIGLLVPDLANSLFSELLLGAEDEASRHDYTLLLGRSNRIRPGGPTIDWLIGEGRVDGIAVQFDDRVHPASLTDLLTSGAPLTLINSSYPGHVGSVMLNDEEGARIATEHLLSLGHSRIALINGLPRSLTAQRRRRGVLNALREAGLSMPREYETRRGYRPDEGADALERLTRLSTAPTAVVVANVNAAIGALARARALGIAVPHDLSVVTVHDSWSAENTWPPLTAVKMQQYEMGRLVVQATIARIETGAVTDATVTDPAPELMVRESSRALT